MSKKIEKQFLQKVGEYFNDLPYKVYKTIEISSIISLVIERWNLKIPLSFDEMLRLLLDKALLRRIDFKFPSRKEIRYVWGTASDYEIIQSLKSNSYFTHYTAMYINELTEQIPNVIYINFEQPLKRGSKQPLLQERIDSAFRRQPRISQNIAPFGERKVCLLNGMYTGLSGVSEIVGELGEKIRVTNMERTLIDIVVRPMYAGGVHQVLNAFRKAQGVVSINKLVAIYDKLKYTYPYHQAIGFYLQRAGSYSPALLELLKKFDMKYDFYLTYQMERPTYSEEWRLYYPFGL